MSSKSIIKRGMGTVPVLLAVCICLVGMSLYTGCVRKPDSDTVPGPGPSVSRAGLRASGYGAGTPFPSPSYWKESTGSMAAKFKGASPSVVWIVGVMDGENNKFNGKTRVNFPAPADAKPGEYPDIVFASSDQNEEYLNVFDREGVKVWLQVEPADADIPKLIRLCLDRYGSHPCVVGFGVDVEWYRWSEDNKEGVAITDEQARSWGQVVRSYNKEYLLFFKHWLQSKMPPTERSGLMFLDDSQIFGSMDEMVDEFEAWGRAFSPAPVGFQYGYPRDRHWWQKLNDPPGDIGKAILKRVPNTTDLYWVDFTMKEIWPN